MKIQQLHLFLSVTLKTICLYKTSDSHEWLQTALDVPVVPFHTMKQCHKCLSLCLKHSTVLDK